MLRVIVLEAEVAEAPRKEIYFGAGLAASVEQTQVFQRLYRVKRANKRAKFPENIVEDVSIDSIS